MPSFNQDNIETILETCRENRTAIAESLNQCIDSKYRIEIGESLPWSPDSLSPAFDGPGLTVGFTIAGQGVFCLIPESLPLPDWYTNPGDSEDSRLQTLAMEWPMNMLPMEFEAEEFRTIAVENLKSIIAEAKPLEWSVVLELLLFHEDDSARKTTEPQNESESSSEAESSAEAAASESESTDSGPSGSDEKTIGQEEGKPEPHATILMVWPVSELTLLTPQTSSGEDAVSASPNESSGSGSSPEAETPRASTGPSPQMQHLLNIPVKVMVCLAEKRMEMETLLTLTPGSLITFTKSCEDLLELYVNNHLYCRGEAIKIDEKFGLKINEVDVTEEQKNSILGM
jgi:flagellar motor switch protein FliN/FliY